MRPCAVRAGVAEPAAARPRPVLGEVRAHPVPRGARESAPAAPRDEVVDAAR
ncbi:hypothetical protein [Streptomyces cinereospinus]|uniref:Uncharacterized protein n=1 Tax=Streptomyces cinereospinus TaxID=285561 RepID=A0ABV5N786_9ACTN